MCSVCSVVQLCLTLCVPMDCSLSGSSVHRIFQARILAQVAISYSMGSSWPRDELHIVALIVDSFWYVWIFSTHMYISNYTLLCTKLKHVWRRTAMAERVESSTISCVLLNFPFSINLILANGLWSEVKCVISGPCYLRLDTTPPWTFFPYTGICKSSADIVSSQVSESLNPRDKRNLITLSLLSDGPSEGGWYHLMFSRG